jgi:hypothetical protein
MNHLHLQETARHYANLAEQYRSQLAEEQELNEDLLGLVEALCEELDIDVEALFEDMALTQAGHAIRVNQENDLIAKGQYKKSWASQDKTNRLLRSDKVHDETGKVVHKGAKGLGWSATARDPSDEDVKRVQGVVGEVGHIVSAPDDEDYATSSDDVESTAEHPVYRRILKPGKPATPKAAKVAKKK